jgi:hypothetical protein
MLEMEAGNGNDGAIPHQFDFDFDFGISIWLSQMSQIDTRCMQTAPWELLLHFCLVNFADVGVVQKIG